MELLREEGTVIDVKEGKVTIRLAPVDPDACLRCGLCVASARAAEERRVVHISSDRLLQVGQKVLVEVRQPGSGAAGMALFGIPLACMAAVAGLSAFFCEIMGVTGVAGSAVMIAAGAIGFLISLLFIKRLEAHWSTRGAFSPKIIGTFDVSEER